MNRDSYQDTAAGGEYMVSAAMSSVDCWFSEGSAKCYWGSNLGSRSGSQPEQRTASACSRWIQTASGYRGRRDWKYTLLSLDSSGNVVACQDDADRNVPELLACRDLAPVLFLSVEPLIGPIDFKFWNPRNPTSEGEWMASVEGVGVIGKNRPVNWVIVGGESGHNARPCNVDWIRSIVRQCRAAGARLFVKQLGSHVIDRYMTIATTFPLDQCWPDGTITDHHRVRLRDPKGGNQFEWPEDLRVREFPEVRP